MLFAFWSKGNTDTLEMLLHSGIGIGIIIVLAKLHANRVTELERGYGNPLDAERVLTFGQIYWCARLTSDTRIDTRIDKQNVMVEFPQDMSDDFESASPSNPVAFVLLEHEDYTYNCPEGVTCVKKIVLKGFKQRSPGASRKEPQFT
ncbi:hypothetical protein COB55_01035 [Candidatus Wolfebacteria bacterium]|nr:MAG: hypothetical protein COB55_01035 [Candidatus Wolfebacteria bacterium]